MHLSIEEFEPIIAGWVCSDKVWCLVPFRGKLAYFPYSLTVRFPVLPSPSPVAWRDR
jgi:hypothetical protein